MDFNQNPAPMLDVVVLLVIIALVFLFLRAGRQNSVVHRRKATSSDRDYSIGDHSTASGSSAPSDYYTENSAASCNTVQETPVFGGGEFGGGGAGDSYEVAAGDPFANDAGTFEAVGGDFSSGDSESGSNDSGSDSCSDPSGGDSSYSSD